MVILNLNSISKKYANLLTRIKKRAKALYYQDTLESHRHDTHATWKTLKEIFASSANRSLNNQPPYIEANSKNLTCAEDIADEFNNFFTSIGEKLVSNIAQQSEVSSSFYLRNKIFSSIYLHPPSFSEVYAQYLLELTTFLHFSSNRLQMFSPHI